MKKRAFKISIIFIGIVVFLLYIAMPIGFGLFTSFRVPREVGKSPNFFRDILLTAEDGVKLKAWYASSKNGASIVVIHGSTGSRESIRKHINMLYKNGFGVLAFDLRGCGESEGEGNAFGWNSSKDLKTALDYLKKQTDVKVIGGLGTSLGSEILLSGISTYPEFKAIVSDGATYRSIDDYLIIESRRNLIYSWVTRVMYASSQFFTGDTNPITIVDSIKVAQSTPLLLIAAGNVKDETLYNKRFLEIANSRSEMWIVPNTNHVQAIKKYPDEYEKRVIDFFNEQLLSY